MANSGGAREIPPEQLDWSLGWWKGNPLMPHFMEQLEHEGIWQVLGEKQQHWSVWLEQIMSREIQWEMGLRNLYLPLRSSLQRPSDLKEGEVIQLKAIIIFLIQKMLENITHRPRYRNMKIPKFSKVNYGNCHHQKAISKTKTDILWKALSSHLSNFKPKNHKSFHYDGTTIVLWFNISKLFMWESLKNDIKFSRVFMS